MAFATSNGASTEAAVDAGCERCAGWACSVRSAGLIPSETVLPLLVGGGGGD